MAAQALYHARRYDDALRQLRRTLEMFPNRGSRLYNQIAEVYEQKRMFAEAFAARQQALSLNKDPNVTALGEAYKRAGYRGWLLKAVQIEEQGPHNFYNFSALAHLYVMLDDEAHAMSYLERAYEEHRPTTLFVRTAPELDSIRSSPRFRDLVRRISFPQPSSDKN